MNKFLKVVDRLAGAAGIYYSGHILLVPLLVEGVASALVEEDGKVHKHFVAPLSAYNAAMLHVLKKNATHGLFGAVMEGVTKEDMELGVRLQSTFHDAIVGTRLAGGVIRSAQRVKHLVKSRHPAYAGRVTLDGPLKGYDVYVGS